MPSSTKLLLFASMQIYCQAAWPEPWQAKFDLLTAGAAASVVSIQLCHGDSAGRQAAVSASKRLLQEANTLVDDPNAPADAYAYSQDAYSLKIKAMWQANSDLACGDLSRLRDIAIGTGFEAP